MSAAYSDFVCWACKAGVPKGDPCGLLRDTYVICLDCEAHFLYLSSPEGLRPRMEPCPGGCGEMMEVGLVHRPQFCKPRAPVE